MSQVKLIECPRDAWQGLPQIIPVETKVEYHRALLAAGFRHIDAVSFVSPKHVPQMADSEEVMKALGSEVGGTSSASSSDAARGSLVDANEGTETAGREIIGIVVNEKGLKRALATAQVTTVGYPYSISAYFRRANANMSREESRALVRKMQKATALAGKQLVVYISMAFGNPYDEPWGPEIVAETLLWLKGAGVKTVSLADTIGTASAKEVGELFRMALGVGGGAELGVHLHSRREGAGEKLLAAFEAGCRRFDSAIGGLGGCPFAGDELVGNLPTEIVVEALGKIGVSVGIHPQALATPLKLTNQIRVMYGQAAGTTVH